MIPKTTAPQLLILALLCAACAAQTAPPIAKSSAEISVKNQVASTLKSLTFTRTGGGNLQFVIEPDTKTSGFNAKILKYEFKDQEESFAIKSASVLEGLQEIFSGKVKINERTTDPNALTGTWSEISLMDLNGKSETIKSPMIKDEKYSRTLEELESTVRDYMKSKDPDCKIPPPKQQDADQDTPSEDLVLEAECAADEDQLN